MTNVFRPAYRKLTSEEQENINAVKEKADDLYDTVEGFMPSDGGRELVLFKTKIEEAIMWAVKGMTK